MLYLCRSSATWIFAPLLTKNSAISTLFSLRASKSGVKPSCERTKAIYSLKITCSSTQNAIKDPVTINTIKTENQALFSLTYCLHTYFSLSLKWLSPAKSCQMNLSPLQCSFQTYIGSTNICFCNCIYHLESNDCSSLR